MIELAKYARKPFFVDAVQVTDDNMDDVAHWCGGERREEAVNEDLVQYIKVKVKRPLSAKQTKAYAGDWVLLAGTGFKVYTDSAFEKGFSPCLPFEHELDEVVEGDVPEKHLTFATEIVAEAGDEDDTLIAALIAE